MTGYCAVMGELTLTLERHGVDFVLHCSGELDLSTAPDLTARLNEVIDAGEGSIRLDLRELTFLDSSGMYALLNAHRRLTRQARRLEIVCASGPVMRAFELAPLVETIGA